MGLLYYEQSNRSIHLFCKEKLQKGSAAITQKKRHNPPIYEEDVEIKGDLAVNAFDRNNDARTESLEQKVETQPNFKVEGWKRIGKKLTFLPKKIAEGCVWALKMGYTIERHIAWPMAKYFSYGFFAGPTCMRMSNSKLVNDKDTKIWTVKELGDMSVNGVAASVFATSFYSLAGFIYLTGSMHPPTQEYIMNHHLWVIPAVHLGTNVISGIKEWHDYESKKAEEEYKQKEETKTELKVE